MHNLKGYLNVAVFLLLAINWRKKRRYVLTSIIIMVTFWPNTRPVTRHSGRINLSLQTLLSRHVKMLKLFQHLSSSDRNILQKIDARHICSWFFGFNIKKNCSGHF
jgi:hypothetical protein